MCIHKSCQYSNHFLNQRDVEHQWQHSKTQESIRASLKASRIYQRSEASVRFDQLLVFSLSQVTSNGLDFILNFSTFQLKVCFQFIQSVFSLYLGHKSCISWHIACKTYNRSKVMCKLTKELIASVFWFDHTDTDHSGEDKIWRAMFVNEALITFCSHSGQCSPLLLFVVFSHFIFLSLLLHLFSLEKIKLGHSFLPPAPPPPQWL